MASKREVFFTITGEEAMAIKDYWMDRYRVVYCPSVEIEEVENLSDGRRFRVTCTTVGGAD